MSSYCRKFGENIKTIILQLSRAIKGGIIRISKCVVCGDKKLNFIKEQEVKGSLINLVIKNL